MSRQLELMVDAAIRAHPRVTVSVLCVVSFVAGAYLTLTALILFKAFS